MLGEILVPRSRIPILPGILFLIGATLISAPAVAEPTGSSAKGSCKQPIAISARDDATLRDAFNRARGSVRLVFLVDPVCATCLRGLKDLDDTVLTPFANDAALQTFVIHTPVLGAEEKDSANTCNLVHSTRVTHYWDPQQEVGTLFADALGMKDGDHVMCGWDVWLVYGPDAEWSGTLPPKADFLMHQLKDLIGREGFPYLNASIFHDEVEKRLKAIVRAPVTQSSR
jgi:hypothetical protein